jgi:hypothetical protein
MIPFLEEVSATMSKMVWVSSSSKMDAISKDIMLKILLMAQSANREQKIICTRVLLGTTIFTEQEESSILINNKSLPKCM